MQIKSNAQIKPSCCQIVVRMQVGIVLDQGLGGLAKTSKLTQKHKNKVKNVQTDLKTSKQMQKTQNELKRLKTA